VVRGTHAVLRRKVGLIAWAAIGLVTLVGISLTAYFAYDTVEKQRADIKLLVTDLAATSLARDDLLAQRNWLTTERDRRTSERDAERTRAEVAEATVSGQAASLAESTKRLAALQEQTDASHLEVKRLGDDISTLRDRLQSVQAESRDASAAAAALTAARDAQQRLSTGALMYANAETDLAKTRETMIDTLSDQIAAERAGRWTTSNRLVDEYNRLVRVHNQQVDKANTLLANLKKLL
jgi:uncharacterized protein (DUF3084 family)